MQQEPSNLEKARAAWGDTPPAWVCALAEGCDKAGVRKTAGKMGVSPASVSLAVNKRRGYDYGFIKSKIEAVLQALIIPCPIKGAITRVECETEQCRPFLATNSMRARQYRACQQCKYREGK